MVEPVTPNRSLIIPNTGDLVGTWGSAAIVPDLTSIDTMFGGLVTKSLTNASVGLSTADQQNALIRVTGTLTGNCILSFNAPGFYIIDNRCVVGSFYVAGNKSGGGGNVIGFPPGKKTHIYYDGTDVDYVDLDAVGSYWDYAGGAIPAWITACTVAPWLVCDGSTPLIATYPQLAAILGTSYGGNGINTFGLPDARNRYRIPIDTNPGSGFSNRITAGVSGINGQTLGAAGGDQNIPIHTHGVTDPTHSHFFTGDHATIQLIETSGGGLTVPSGGNGATTATQVQPAATGITVNTAGTGTSANLPPAFVAGLCFIKT